MRTAFWSLLTFLAIGLGYLIAMGLLHR